MKKKSSFFIDVLFKSVMTLIAFYVFFISESASQLYIMLGDFTDLLSNTTIDFFHS